MKIEYKRKSGIYKITSKVNNKIYIGSASCIYTRWHCHLYLLKSNKHDNIHLQRIFLKYGEDNLLFEVIEFCEKGNLITREQFYIDNLLPKLNICKYAQNTLGNKHTKETKEYLSLIRKGKVTTGMLNKHHSPETIEKIRSKAKERILVNGLNENFKNASKQANLGRKHKESEIKLRVEKQKKITPLQAFEIKDKRRSGIYQKDIAKEYGISQRLVARIEHGIGVYGDKDYFEQGNERFEKSIAMPLFDAPKEMNCRQLSLA